MAKRKGFRPGAIEALEGRVVPSGNGFVNFVSKYTLEGVIARAVGGKDAAPKPGANMTIGVLGDSYSDEYRFTPPDLSKARNWVEILSDTGRANFGPFSTASRGEPRDQGFANDWARLGATSGDMVASQLPGLAAQAAQGKLKYAVIFIGSDDLLYVLQANQAATAAQAPGVIAQLAQTEAQAEANVTTAVDTLLAASPKLKLVVTTLPDPTVSPVVQAGAAGHPGAEALVAAASQEFQKFDSFIRSTAAANPSRIALNDLADEAVAELSKEQFGVLPFGGTGLSLTTPGDKYHDFFLADGLHPGTAAQGFIANTFVHAIDTHFGARIKPLSESQIVQFAAHVRPTTP